MTVFVTRGLGRSGGVYVTSGLGRAPTAQKGSKSRRLAEEQRKRRLARQRAALQARLSRPIAEIATTLAKTGKVTVGDVEIKAEPLVRPLPLPPSEPSLAPEIAAAQIRLHEVELAEFDRKLIEFEEELILILLILLMDE